MSRELFKNILLRELSELECSSKYPFLNRTERSDKTTGSGFDIRGGNYVASLDLALLVEVGIYQQLDTSKSIVPVEMTKRYLKMRKMW